MKGTKHLAELVDVAMFRKDKLNIIKAPTGSGKTYFALTHIPNLTRDALHSVVYLIDTINGKEQILRNYNTTSEYWGWAKEVDENLMWFSEDNRVVILTYAKFGVLSQKYTDFHANFDYIICDELHSLFQFQNFSPKPNLHSVALMGLRSAVKNSKTTVIALSATPGKIKEGFKDAFAEIPIDQNEIIHYDQDEIIRFTSLEYILSSVDANETGLLYTARITQMIEIETKAREIGLSPVCIWSTANKEHPMTEEQLSVRESILQDYTIPEQYNLVIINSSSETSLKIKSDVDYVIVNSTNEDTQVQVRGRVNSDLRCLYLLNSGIAPLVVPDDFLGVQLFTADKTRLCESLRVRNPFYRPRRWNSIKTMLLESGYCIDEGRSKNKRYAIITLSPE